MTQRARPTTPEIGRPIITDIGLALWRLLPANPIVLRVVKIGGKRPQHFWIRTGYLLIMLFVMLIVVQTQPDAGNSLGARAKAYSTVFQYISVLQLAMMCFLAPVFASGAISQEKDSETFNVLLTTPLSNAQIVLGSLMSRMFFVLILLLSGVPIFCITMLFGGVTTHQIFLSFGIAACTALVTGALAITVSVVRIGTRGTIFSFYAGIAIYLFAGLALGLWSRTHVPESIPPGQTSGMSWLAPYHPFLALKVALNQTPPPPKSAVAHYGWPASTLLASPHTSYMALSLLASVLMVGFATFFVRRGVKQGETSLLKRLLARLRLRRSGESDGERRRRARHVWANPVAWREAAAQGSASGNRLIYYGYLVGGIVAAVALLLAHNGGQLATVSVPVATAVRTVSVPARDWLTGIVLVEFVTVVLMAINSGATAISREREAGTMELLLTTPLTSQYIVWGKLRGLVSFTLPLMAIPAGTVLMMAINDTIHRANPPVVHWTSAILLPPLLLVYSALVCVLSLQMSLKSKGSVQAILTSVGIITVIGFGLGLCAYGTLQTADAVAGITAPFTFVTAIWMVLNPDDIARSLPGRGNWNPDEIQVYLFVGTIIALCLYGGIVAGMYRTMVRDFDIIVRKQSR
jgi:ABC-type transport system involved in multi-copper enzyme maturation permease subunit